ncbi:Pre-mRNA splicing factor PRP21 like protein-domain-containing protein [Zopfochytrium polystomum]|nr:Pre-mRNA splicing factor PRP21 like protein-domain-containing protein [Zopfochytrium polystomum]
MPEAEPKEDVAAPTSVIGIIYPPPEIRKIVDTTATFVSRNGVQFEAKIREDKKHDPKFCFLNPMDPYHAYYSLKVKEEREGKAEPKEEAAKAQPTETVPEAANGKPVPKQPPRFEFLAEMPAISAQDLDILKLTAQFVARNGRQFLNILSQREARNYQFDFLRPNHSLFNYFNSLVTQYNKVLMPTKVQTTRLKASVKNKFEILERINQRVDYEMYQEEEKKKAEAEADVERRAYAMIDWHDFVVVDTVEFVDADETLPLPAPMSIMDLENMTMAQKRQAVVFEAAAALDIEEEDQEMDMEDAEPEDAKEEVKPTPAANSAPNPIKIRADYAPKAGKPSAAPEPMQICQICGVAIKTSEMDEHVRIELLDPKWRERKQALEAKKRDSNLLQGVDVAKNLTRLSGYRTDIFGSDEVEIGKKIGEDMEKMKQAEKEKVIWDGHTASIGHATRQIQQQFSLEDQIAQIQKGDESDGTPKVGPQLPQISNPLPPRPPPIPALVRPPMPMGLPLPRPLPGFVPGPAVPPPSFAPPPRLPPVPPSIPPPTHPLPAKPLSRPPEHELDKPDAKRQKGDGEEALMPEAQFIALNPDPIVITVQPSSGPPVTVDSIAVTMTVEELKEKLSSLVSMAPNKQKLVLASGITMKNALSLAYYNLRSGDTLNLSTRERGGKK